MSFMNMFSLGLLFGTLSLLGAKAQAAPFCGTLSECIQLQSELTARQAKLAEQETQITARIRKLTEQPSNLGDFVRDSNSKVRSMSYDDADAYCKSQGTRLPTVRELAVHAQSLGAQGISETYELNSYSIEMKTIDGKRDVFYFDGDGYKHPPNQSDHAVWSSSFRSVGRPTPYILGWSESHFPNIALFDEWWAIGRNNAVRCVR